MNHKIKLNRAIEHYTGFKGPETLYAICKQIPDCVLEKLNSEEVAVVMTAINNAYQNGLDDGFRDLKDVGVLDVKKWS